MPIEQCRWFAENSSRLPDDVAHHVMDQLWLRTVLIEQRRRVPIVERAAFDERADRLLAALDPAEVSA